MRCIRVHGGKSGGAQLRLFQAKIPFALVLLTGQWYAHPIHFDAYVLVAGQEAAKQHAARCAHADV